MASVLDLLKGTSVVEVLGFITLSYIFWRAATLFIDTMGRLLLEQAPRKVVIPLFKEQSCDVLGDVDRSSNKYSQYDPKTPKFDPSKLKGEKNTVYKWDPSTLDYFGSMPAMSKAEVCALVLNLVSHPPHLTHTHSHTHKHARHATLH